MVVSRKTPAPIKRVLWYYLSSRVGVAEVATTQATLCASEFWTTITSGRYTDRRENVTLLSMLLAAALPLVAASLATLAGVLAMTVPELVMPRSWEFEDFS